MIHKHIRRSYITAKDFVSYKYVSIHGSKVGFYTDCSGSKESTRSGRISEVTDVHTSWFLGWTRCRPHTGHCHSWHRRSFRSRCSRSHTLLLLNISLNMLNALH